MKILERLDNTLFNLTGVGKLEIADNKENYEARMELPSVTGIGFWKFSEEQIRIAESVKPHLGYRKDYEKFIESMKDGSSGWLDMYVIDEITLPVQTVDSFDEFTYGRVMSTEGIRYREFVLEPLGQPLFYDNTTDKKFTLKPCYLIHYFIGDEHGRYLLVDEINNETFAYIREGLNMDYDYIREL